MKSITTIIVAMLLSSSLYAGDRTQQSRLASDMRIMLKELGNIQVAGFYKNKSGIDISARRLISSLDSIIESDASLYLPDSKSKAGKFAKKRASMIKMYAQDLVVSMQDDDMDEAMEDYAQIMRQCTSCHSRIRQREWK